MSGATGAWCVCACSVERDRLIQAAAADAYERGRRDVLAERDDLAETLRLRSEALNRVAADRGRLLATLARVEALTVGPTGSGYQPYAVDVAGEVQLAVLLDDLRAALTGGGS